MASCAAHSRDLRYNIYFLISWYILILLCRLKRPCYLAVPHCEAVSYLSWVFLHYLETLPVIPSLFWMRAPELCGLFGPAVWHSSFLSYSLPNSPLSSSLGHKHGQEIYSSLPALQGSWPLSREQSELWQVVLSEATQTRLFDLFFLAKIYLSFLQFRRSVVVSYTLAVRVFFKAELFFILLQHENLKFWTCVFLSEFLVLSHCIAIEI